MSTSAVAHDMTPAPATRAPPHAAREEECAALSHNIRRQMEQAIAALAARRHALAQHQAVALEGHDLGLAPRRVMEMDARRGLSRLDLGAEVDERLEQAAV